MEIVLASLIAALGSMLAATIAGLLQLRKRIGKPNGNGNIAAMSESVLISIGEIKSDLKHVSRRLDSIEKGNT